MDFKLDAQTKHDLDLFTEIRNGVSIFKYFDVTRTKGGRDSLFQLFSTPSNEIQFLNMRKDAIKFMVENKLHFEFDYLELDFIEHYLLQNIPVLRDNVVDALFDKAWNAISPKSEYYIISRGVNYLKTHISKFKKFADSMQGVTLPVLIKQIILDIEAITNKAEFQNLLKPKSGLFSLPQLNRDDRLIRKTQRQDVLKIIEHTYLLDALLSVAEVAVKNKLSFPEFDTSAKARVKIKGMFHPFLKDPVLNDIVVGDEGNLCFVSGPNMAGKSTFLKSVGVCIYLAQIGFPVPAKEMETTLFNGMLSSINLSDNINKGYSHYYTEVRRVKEILLIIKEKSRVCVIFDELFKGTNVKDAYDATLLVLTGFSKMKENIFFASTHIIEVASELKKENSIIFKYLDSSLNGTTPVYNYKLVDGISSERLGLLIVKQEGIVKIIDEILQKK